MDVPAKKIKKNSGESDTSKWASHVQKNKDCHLEETIRQAEQKFSLDLKMIAMETTKVDKLLKTLVCIERKTTTQIPDEYKQYTRNLSTRFGVMFYDDKK